ncbi:MAG: hypothetical protein IKR48_00800 [Kiritimatiellae bacterium]|nr:hypothetical protein [Kiritimatiellia bacterium]
MQPVIAMLAASMISPFFVEVAPEIRSTYVSLGKLVEDRPMQITSLRAGYDTETFGRFGVRNWDVSSLTDRRSDVHQHAIYHWEFGPTWDYGLKLADDWKLNTDITRSWTIYRGFRADYERSEFTSWWWQIDQSLENPYLVPFYRIRRTFHPNDWMYFKSGVRKRIELWKGLYVTPSVFVEGGNGRNLKRVLGHNRCDDDWGNGGVSSATARLELGWKFNQYITLFTFVEQYEIVGHDARTTNGASTYRCAHNDWTLGGAGLRIKF